VDASDSAKADVLVHATPSGSGADSLVLLVVRERSHDDLALCRREEVRGGLEELRQRRTLGKLPSHETSKLRGCRRTPRLPPSLVFRDSLKDLGHLIGKAGQTFPLRHVQRRRVSGGNRKPSKGCSEVVGQAIEFHYPNVKQKASAPASRNSISNRRSRIGPG
jgi:hypothetical protein